MTLQNLFMPVVQRQTVAPRQLQQQSDRHRNKVKGKKGKKKKKSYIIAPCQAAVVQPRLGLIVRHKVGAEALSKVGTCFGPSPCPLLKQGSQ